MRVVFDTNIIVASVIAPHGYTAHIIELAEQQAFDLVVSEPILREYEATLQRPDVQRRHQLSPEVIHEEIIEGIRKFAFLVTPTIKVQVVSADPDDDKFIECAVAGTAEIIVSSDPHLLDIGSYNDIQIVTPAGFLHLLEQQDAA